MNSTIISSCGLRLDLRCGSTLPMLSPFLYKRTNECLLELYSCRDLTELSRFGVEMLPLLVECNRTTWTDFRKEGGVSRCEWKGHEEHRKDEILPIIARYVPTQHPAVTLLDPHKPMDSCYLISDLVSRVSFEKTELFNEGYLPVESRYQLSFQSYASSNVYSAGVLHRMDKEFSEKERKTLDYMIPHLRLASTRLLREQRAAEACLPASEEGEGWICYDESFYLLDANATALRYLEFSFGFDGIRLPEVLVDSLERGGSGGRSISEEVKAGGQRFILTGRESWRLSARYVSIKQITTKLVTITSKYDDVLTRREREIARWIRAGKTNVEIGLILEISHRTVGKHVENLYRKVGAENRFTFLANF